MKTMKMVLCSKCHEKIEKNAKICPHCKAKRTNPMLGIILLSIGLLLVMRNGCSAVHAQNTSNSIDLKTLHSIVTSMKLGEGEIAEYYKPETKITNNTVVQTFKQKEEIYRDGSGANFKFNFDVTYRIENSNTIIMNTSGTLEKTRHPDLLLVTALEENEFYPHVYMFYITLFMLGSANKKGVISEEQIVNILTQISEPAIINYPLANLSTYIATTVKKTSPFKWKYSRENRLVFN